MHGTALPEQKEMMKKCCAETGLTTKQVTVIFTDDKSQK
jgi:hypothetical protein